MQKTLPMHLNTSPTSFEGSGTGKTRKRHKTLKNLKLAPKKHLGLLSNLVMAVHSEITPRLECPRSGVSAPLASSEPLDHFLPLHINNLGFAT